MDVYARAVFEHCGKPYLSAEQQTFSANYGKLLVRGEFRHTFIIVSGIPERVVYLLGGASNRPNRGNRFIAVGIAVIYPRAVFTRYVEVQVVGKDISFGIFFRIIAVKRFDVYGRDGCGLLVVEIDVFVAYKFGCDRKVVSALILSDVDVDTLSVSVRVLLDEFLSVEGSKYRKSCAVYGVGYLNVCKRRAGYGTECQFDIGKQPIEELVRRHLAEFAEVY